MSLILDALRKSEAERRRGQSPDLYGTSVTSPAPSRDAFRHWPILAGGALVLLAVALLFWPHTPPDSGAGTPAGASAVAMPTATQADASPPAATPMPIAAPPLLAPTPPTQSAPTHLTFATPPVPARLATDAALPTAAVPLAPQLQSPTPTATPTPTPPPASVEPTPPRDDLPTLAILAPGERAALPPLKLSMHVWNSDPGQRFAIVDGQRLTEGATIGGAVVAEIRRDGVVLDVNGRRVLLPRP